MRALLGIAARFCEVVETRTPEEGAESAPQAVGARALGPPGKPGTRNLMPETLYPAGTLRGGVGAGKGGARARCPAPRGHSQPETLNAYPMNHGIMQHEPVSLNSQLESNKEEEEPVHLALPARYAHVEHTR